MRETNCYNNLDEIPPSIRKVQTVLFRVNFAPWTAFPPTDNYPVQCPVQHVIPTKMYRENPPRLRLSTYSSLNVDTEE